MLTYDGRQCAAATTLVSINIIDEIDAERDEREREAAGMLQYSLNRSSIEPS